MDCEERLVTQVQLTTAATPGTTVFVYRNAIKARPRVNGNVREVLPMPRFSVQALPWYTLVRQKITDPAYSAWFMRFGPPTVGNGWFVPQCDSNYDPPLCSDLYHGKRCGHGVKFARGRHAPVRPSISCRRPRADPREPAVHEVAVGAPALSVDTTAYNEYWRPLLPPTALGFPYWRRELRRACVRRRLRARR